MLNNPSEREKDAINRAVLANADEEDAKLQTLKLETKTDYTDDLQNLSNLDIEKAYPDKTFTIDELEDYVQFRDYVLDADQGQQFEDVLGPQFKGEMEKQLEYIGENGIDGGELGLSHYIVDSRNNRTCVIDYIRPGSDLSLIHI